MAELLAWLRRVLLGETPPSARFDIQVHQRVLQQLQRRGVGEPPSSALSADMSQVTMHAGEAGVAASATGSRLEDVRAREAIPNDYLARQSPEHRKRLLQVFAYRDRLQKILDGDWTVLNNEEIYLRALEGYRWLELLEREIAKEPHRFSPRLDDAREVLERFVQHALQHRSGR